MLIFICACTSINLDLIKILSQDLWLYLVDVQGLHGVFYQLDVDLGLLWLKLLVRNELSLCKKIFLKELNTYVFICWTQNYMLLNKVPNAIMVVEYRSVSSHLLGPCKK